MSKSYGSKDLSEAFQDFLTGCAKVLFGLGTLAAVIAVGLLVFTCFRVTADDGQQMVAGALNNIDIFRKVLIAGLLGVAVGSTYLFWGEELLGAIQVICAAILYFAPLFLPGLINNGTTNEASRKAFGVIQEGGAIFGVLAIAVLVVDIAIRVRTRAQQGYKADQIKLGKGVKEENDKQNVFLGKCWQLPYCRKFVRDRCPIYHARRTCWRELVGCMCEEQVIRDAMENKAIPKDELLAAKMIPRNHRLNDAMKKERCRSCVIYNEHQKHKYKAALPMIVVGTLAVYGLLHGPLFDITQGILGKINKVVSVATMTNGTYDPPSIFVEGLLAVMVLVLMSYLLRLLEFLVFKLKI